MVPFLATLALVPFSGEFTLHRAIDSTTGKVAYRYLLPKGWKAKDDLKWDLGDKRRPLTFQSTLTSPDGKTRIAVLPTETRTFTVQNGQLAGTIPPETATKALDNVLSATHPELQSAHLVVRKDFDVPSPFEGQGLKTKGMVGVLEVEFPHDGVTATELLSVTEYEGSQAGEGGAVNGVWTLTAGYTLTCDGPMTEAAFKTFAVVVASNRPDPAFFATLMEVSKGLSTGPVDLKAVAGRVKGLTADTKPSYQQNLSLHAQSSARIFPIYAGLGEVTTFDGPIAAFKGQHVWMRKPNEYLVTESSEPSPGVGWQPAKEAP